MLCSRTLRGPLQPWKEEGALRSTIELLRNRRKRETPTAVVDSLKDCDIQLQAMARCDDRIAKFEELLMQMRTDLYGSIEALSNKIESTAAATAPPKRSMPRIISAKNQYDDFEGMRSGRIQGKVLRSGRLAVNYSYKK